MAANAKNNSSNHPLNYLKPEEERENPPAKKSKRQLPPSFWETLSEVRLTPLSLREFDRRTRQSSSLPAAETRTSHPERRQLRPDYLRLKQSASKGGPDLSVLRGFSDVVQGDVGMSEESCEASSVPSGSGTEKGRISPYNREFEVKLGDEGVYQGRINTAKNPAEVPGNMKALLRTLSARRPSLSLSTSSNDAFTDFQDANHRAFSESDCLIWVVPLLIGATDREQAATGTLQFNNLMPFHRLLMTPAPDRYYGAWPEEIDLRVRNDLNKYIIPSTQTNLPAAPNFFAEIKCLSGRPDVARRQALHNGAFGARAMFQLQNYGSPSQTYDGNAYTLSATYIDGVLKIYAMTPKLSQSGYRTEYYLTLLTGHEMTSSVNGFLDGVTAYRNARDWTKQQRDRFIANANAVAQAHSMVLDHGEDS